MTDQRVTAKSDSSSISTELASRRTGMSFQRTRMSADRTLMSVIRTSLSLISFGFTIFQFFHTLGADYLADGIPPDAPRRFGGALVATASGIRPDPERDARDRQQADEQEQDGHDHGE